MNGKKNEGSEDRQSLPAPPKPSPTARPAPADPILKWSFPAGPKPTTPTRRGNPIEHMTDNPAIPLRASSSQPHVRAVSEEFNRADYSFVVKRRGGSSKPWRWEIYCACKSVPVERSLIFFESMTEAVKEGKKALAQLLAKRSA